MHIAQIRFLKGVVGVHSIVFAENAHLKGGRIIILCMQRLVRKHTHLKVGVYICTAGILDFIMHAVSITLKHGCT